MSNAAQLPDGTYKISSKYTGCVVGRSRQEDKSLRPKAIYTLDPPTNPIEGGRLWTIINVGDGKFKMEAGKAPVGDDDNLLWAFLSEHGRDNAGEWRIIDVPQMGKDCYIVVRPDLMNGWVATLDENPDHKQIGVRPLIVHPSFPPRYPEFQVFVITPHDA